jgi:hypothetical protein
MKLVPLFLCLVLFAALCCGCSSLTGRARVAAPAATVTGPGGASLVQAGDAQTPATAATSAGRSAFTIPQGQPVSLAPDGTATFTAAAPIVVTASFDTFKASGPSAFTPPAPPTPTDEAAGRASLWFRLGLALGVATGVFGLVKGWDAVAIGGGAVAVACLVALSLAAIPVWVWIVLGVGAAAIVGGPALWHLRVKHLTPPPVTAQTA